MLLRWTIEDEQCQKIGRGRQGIEVQIFAVSLNGANLPTLIQSPTCMSDLRDFNKATMKKTMAICFVLSLLTCGVAPAQDTMNRDDGQKTYASQMPIQLLGTISNTGETFVSDKGGKNWTIVNRDAVKGHEGHHVLLTANVDADKNEVNVVSLKMAKK
jgi:hypothetical protein